MLDGERGEMCVGDEIRVGSGRFQQIPEHRAVVLGRLGNVDNIADALAAAEGESFR